MLVEGNDPYWDDSDPQDKKWRFPGNPELEAMANDRSRNLDADEEDENFEQASDLRPNDGVTINTVSPTNVGTYQDDAVDVGAEVKAETSVTQTEPVETTTEPVVETSVSETPESQSLADDSSEDDGGDDGYDDLPF